VGRCRAATEANFEIKLTWRASGARTASGARDRQGRAYLIGDNGEPEYPLWVDFPLMKRATIDLPIRRRNVVGARVPQECDLAILYLEDAIPTGIRPVQLRRPLAPATMANKAPSVKRSIAAATACRLRASPH
jgi:hypothetical protein